MATGTPLLATTGGAIPEVAGRDGDTCLAVPPGDAGALAAGLGRLLGDPALRARLGAAGRQRVLERFTWARAAEGTVARYREAIADGGRARVAPATGAHGATETPDASRVTGPRPRDREVRASDGRANRRPDHVDDGCDEPVQRRSG